MNGKPEQQVGEVQGAKRLTRTARLRREPIPSSSSTDAVKRSQGVTRICTAGRQTKMEMLPKKHVELLRNRLCNRHSLSRRTGLGFATCFTDCVDFALDACGLPRRKRRNTLRVCEPSKLPQSDLFYLHGGSLLLNISACVCARNRVDRGGCGWVGGWGGSKGTSHGWRAAGGHDVTLCSLS